MSFRIYRVKKKVYMHTEIQYSSLYGLGADVITSVRLGHLGHFETAQQILLNFQQFFCDLIFIRKRNLNCHF